MHVNLLSDSFQWSRLVRARTLLWGIHLLWISAVGVMWNAPITSQYWAAYNATQSLREVVQPVQAMQSEGLRLARESTQIHKEIQTLDQLVAHDKISELVALIGEAACREHTPIQIRDLSIVRASASNKAASPSTSPNAGSISKSPAIAAPAVSSNNPGPPSTNPANSKTQLQITLRGIARSGADISRFIESLHALEVFSSVDLKSARDSRIGETDIEEFELGCLCNE